MREINSGRVVTLDSGHQPLFSYGLDANKPASPNPGDTYYATDTLNVYTCYMAGTWTTMPWGMSQGRRISKEELSVVQGTWAQAANVNQTDFDTVFVNGTVRYNDQTVLANTTYSNALSHTNLDEFKVPNFRLLPGTYLFQIVSMNQDSAGILEVLHGNTSLATFDLYGASTFDVVLNFFYTLSTPTIADLRFRVNGKNAGSTSYILSLSRIEITRQTIPQSATAPTYVKGALYFDTALNKLRVGEASVWQSLSIFNTQTNKTATNTMGTVYQNTSGKPMLVSVSAQSSTGGILSGYSDASNPPTTKVAQHSNSSGEYIPISFIVLPGNYYRCDMSGSITIPAWIEYT